MWDLDQEMLDCVMSK